MIVEQGTHQSLIDAQGVYFGLVEQQNLPELKEKTHPINYAEQENIKIISTDHIEEEEEPSSIINTLFENKDNSISKDSIDKKTKNNITFQMLLMNKPEWLIIIFGCISCICNGGIQPAFGIILSKLTAVKFFFLFFYKSMNFIQTKKKRFFKNVMNKFKKNEFYYTYFYLLVLLF